MAREKSKIKTKYMCSSDCWTCENLFSLNQEKQEQAEYSQKSCSCKDKDYPFYF